MTSAQTSFPQRLTKIDEITRGDHHYLRADDVCLFLGEYTARAGFSHSATNKLIINFKKPMDRRGRDEWRYKAINITAAANALFNALNTYDLRQVSFVPVPPSKMRADPMYDDRIMSMLGQLSGLFQASKGYPLDIREVVSQRISTAAAHDGGPRPTPDALAQNYEVDHQALAGLAPQILICDDVLTTGSHYRAMCEVLRPHLPGSHFAGLFLARRVPEADDVEVFR